MPSDAQGHTRDTMEQTKSLDPGRKVGGSLNLLTWKGLPAVHADMNEELLVSTSDQLVLNMSLRVVHTARRCYRWCRRRDLCSMVFNGFPSGFPCLRTRRFLEGSIRMH